MQQVFKLIQEATGALGGNGDGGSTYGEITMGSLHKIFDFMSMHCEFNHSSRFCDLGSGVGKPNWYATQRFGLRLSIGVECELIRHQVQTYLNLLNFDPQAV